MPKCNSSKHKIEGTDMPGTFEEREAGEGVQGQGRQWHTTSFWTTESYPV